MRRPSTLVTGLPWRRQVLPHSCDRTGHVGCRIGLAGRWDETQLAGQISATYVTIETRFHIYYRQFHQTIAYLLRKYRADCRS